MHHHLNQSDRACIAALLRKQYTYSAIARVLDVHPSTVSREVRRNSHTLYKVHQAQRAAKHRRANARIEYRIIDTNEVLEQQVTAGLQQDWSPDQIKRRRKYGTKRIPSRYQANKRSIHTRPTINTIDHWEGDTVLGSERKIRIVTYVDRVSWYLIAAKTPGGADAIHAQAKKQFKHVPCQSITYDNGSEFALHQLIERDTKATVYFADPGAPHQRGANENCNGLLRQYFPKGSSFASISNSDVQRAVTRLNNRPRKRLNYLTPREYLEKEGVRLG